MTHFLLAIVAILSFANTSQTKECGCFDGIASTSDNEPRLTVQLGNGVELTVCGGEQKELSKHEILIAEFDVFDCKTGTSLVEYGANQFCLVKKDQHVLQISELKFLPAGKNWTWESIKIGSRQIFVKENKLVVLDTEPAFDPFEIERALQDNFLEELRGLKGLGLPQNPEEVLGRLEILALNKVDEAITILYDFENYFGCETDGAIAEQWKDAVATVKWIRK